MHHHSSAITLQTNDDAKVLRIVDFEKFGDTSGYRCTLVVRSGGFSCERSFCFDDSHFPDAVAALQKMDAGQPGEATIKGQWDDDFIRFLILVQPYFSKLVQTSAAQNQ